MSHFFYSIYSFISIQLQNSIYGNNVNITEPYFEPMREETVNVHREEFDSTYDHLMFMRK